MDFNKISRDKFIDACTQITGDLPTLISLKPPKVILTSKRTQTEDEKPDTIVTEPEPDLEDQSKLMKWYNREFRLLKALNT